MSNRGTLMVFRGVTAAAMCSQLSELAPALPPLDPPLHYESRYVEWRIDVAASDTVAVVSVPLYSSGVPVLIGACAAALDCPWLIIDKQEGDHWDYSLNKGAIHLHSFSTFPQYWSNDPGDAEGRRGDPHQLASLWGLPVEQVAPYVRNWGEKPNGRISRRRVLRGKARPGDHSPYGDMWQYLDFLRALGSPQLDKDDNWISVTIRVPDLVYIPTR